MPTSVLVGYATRYGSTKEVAEEVAAVLRESGLQVELLPAREVGSIAIYDAVVLGAPLFMFHWHKDALSFLTRHSKALMERPVAVFAVGPVHAPHDEKEWADTSVQFDKELAKFPWFTPVAKEIIGGRYDPTKLRFPLNLFSGAEPASDIMDQAAVRAWAGSLVAKLAASPNV